jgi:hypothetical protein
MADTYLRLWSAKYVITKTIAWWEITFSKNKTKNISSVLIANLAVNRKTVAKFNFKKSVLAFSFNTY